MHRDLIEVMMSANRRRVLAVCLILGAGIAVTDYLVQRDLSLGILYIIPLFIAAVFLSESQVVLCAIVAAFLREQLRPDAWHEGSASFGLSLIAFTCLGLFVAEMVQSRKRQTEDMRKFQEESTLRQKAEQEARAVIESSPAAIITIGPDGNIEMTNEAAKRLLALGSTPAQGWPISTFFPILGELKQSRRSFRPSGTMLEGDGRRANGEHFFAQIWLSSYETAVGAQMAAVITDASDQLRDREELGLRQLLMSSRIIAAAVSHEIRNMAAAAHALHSNIGKSIGITKTDDFQALGQLIEGMRRLSAAEVPTSAEQVLTGIDMNSVLRELSIIIRAEVEDAGIELIWEIADDLPRVRADHSGLLQVLLNLLHNSIRALSTGPDRKISVAAYKLSGSVLVRFSDNGPGIARPEILFQPFQAGASATGLGLCISRAIIRTFGGELRYMKRSNEGCFLIELPAASVEALVHV